MHDGPEVELIRDLARQLRGTVLEREMILGGSSGLFGFSTGVPAFTEDLDFLIREELVVAEGIRIIDLLGRVGFQRQPDTPTFTAPGKPMFDLVGYSTANPADHLSPPGPLRVMVFGDIGIVLGAPSSVTTDADGVAALSPFAFCALKLTTVRVEKGSKDKLQALLVIRERRDDRSFREGFLAALSRFDRDRIADAFGDAQAAFLSLQRDPEFRDRGAEGYRALLERAEEGFAVLNAWFAGGLHG